MYKECKNCKERLMIVEEGFPAYAHGSFIIYGCPTCGNMEFEYDSTNAKGNLITNIYDPKRINMYHVSN